MKRYYDYNTEEVYTEDELYAFWVQESQLDYPDFKKWLEEAFGKNGTLEKIADDWDIDNKRKWTALKIAPMINRTYEDTLKALRELKVHDNWTEEDILTRPTDCNELAEIVDEYFEERGVMYDS